MTEKKIFAGERLRRAREQAGLKQTTLVAADLDAAFAALDATASSTYSVAWIDCVARGNSLGRSLIVCGGAL